MNDYTSVKEHINAHTKTDIYIYVQINAHIKLKEIKIVI